MYPHPDLIRLDAHKVALRRRIAARRADCDEHVTRVLRPQAWIDDRVALWRRVSPFARLAVIPLVLLLKRRRVPAGAGIANEPRLRGPTDCRFVSGPQ